MSLKYNSLVRKEETVMQKIIITLLLVSLLCTLFIPIVSAAPAKASRPEVKILSIGHSYAWNSVEYLREIGVSQGVDITVAVVYRGNCSLQIHLNNFKNNTLYGEKSGNPGFYLKYSNEYPDGKQIMDTYSIGKAVKDEKWDYIMFQESLDKVGFYHNIEESLPELKKGVANLATNPSVKYMWHDIWAMEKKEAMPTDKVELKPYNWDQQTMYEGIKSTTAQVLSSDVGIYGVVPTGEAFQLARQSGKYDPSKGGISLNADVISHANIYGKYLAGLVWYMSFTGCSIDKQTLTYPSEITKEQAMELVDFAEQAVVGTGKTLGTVDEVFKSQSDDETSSKTSSKTSSELVYNPDQDLNDEKKPFNPLFLIPVGAAVVAAAAGVVIALKKKKK